MAIAVQILGSEGTGKTYSLRGLSPKETYYINCDKKSMPFRGWKTVYNETNKNYVKTSDISTIVKVLQGVSSQRPEIKSIIVDTVNSVMSDKEMSERRKKGFDKWMDLAGDIYDLYAYANSENLRDDLIVVFIGHTEVYSTSDGPKLRLKTNGQKLSKLNVEGKLTYTFYSQVEMDGETPKYFFTTQTDGYNTARTPYGAFKYSIPNDLNFIVNTITEFENGEFNPE